MKRLNARGEAKFSSSSNKLRNCLRKLRICVCWRETEGGVRMQFLLLVYQDLEKASFTWEIPGKVLEFCSDQKGITLMRASLNICKFCY